ncbi:MAG: hypothetical protein K9G44_00205 [Melioribacteraceae bacterium]|nr:hypothetical protein [Melioribacteraceae bacterium]
MIETVKKNIGQYLLTRSTKKVKREVVLFNGFLKKSKTILMIFPEEEVLFTPAFHILRLFDFNNPRITVIVTNFIKPLIPDKYHITKIVPDEQDINSYGLPSTSFLAKVNSKYDTVINLETKISLFHLGVVANVEKKFSIGFINDRAKGIYNFQVPLDSIVPENSYKNLLNSLKMF